MHKVTFYTCFTMWRKLFLLLVYSQVCAADITELKVGEDGKSLRLVNRSIVGTPGLEFEFQIAGQPLRLNSTIPQLLPDTNETKPISAQQVTCPGTFNDVVLQYLAVDISDSATFQSVELPPFLQTRYTGGPGNTVIREYIKGTFAGLGWTVEEDASVQATPLGFIQVTSVIVTLNPQFPKRLVLGCHFDSKFTPSGFIGAVDAAVSCALLVDLAKKLGPLFRFTEDSPVSIQMIFFDGKEPYVNFSPTDSLYGSRHLSTKWLTTLDPLDATKNKLGNIDTFILLGVLGHAETQFERFYEESDDVFTDLLSLEICLALKGFGTRRLPLNRFLFSTNRRAFEIYDDQVPFVQKGLSKVVHLVTYPFPTQWHTLGDNANILDYTVIEDLNRILRVYIANFISTNGYNYITTGTAT